MDLGVRGKDCEGGPLTEVGNPATSYITANIKLT